MRLKTSGRGRTACSGCTLQAEFLPQFLVDFGRRLPVDALAVGRGFRLAPGVTSLPNHNITRRLDGRAVSTAIVPDAVIIRHHGDIGCFPLGVPHEPDDLGVAAVGGPGEDASDPGPALIAAARVLEVAVENDEALSRRVIMAPGG